MRSVLYSEIRRKKVDTPLQKGKAKLVEVLALKKGGFWLAGEVMIESGLIDKKGRFFPVSEVTYAAEDKVIKLSKPLSKGRKSPLDKHEIYLSRLDGIRVETPEGKDIGRIYDFELYTDMDPWRVWKIMVDPSSLSPLRRRVRIPTKSVEEINDKKVVLEKGWKER